MERSWQEKITNVEIEHSNRRAEEEKKLVILRDREKEAKLNEIKLKEFRKLVLQGRADKEEGDMKEFRHKRNIKYIEGKS